MQQAPMLYLGMEVPQDASAVASLNFAGTSRESKQSR